MSNQQLKNQIIEWLEKQSYWTQYLGNDLLEGGKVTDELVSKAYQLYKEDENLAPAAKGRTPIVFNKKVAEDADPDHALVLQTIKNIDNVNALATGQSIKIGSGLTIIYGNNGTGKSGYVRMLNNAFCSRGDADILHNVFEVRKGEPTCEFTFVRTEEPYDLGYPADKEKYEFSQFAVFDSKSVGEHLGKENQLSFTPSGFHFFEKMIAAQAAMRAKLDAEIDANSAMHDLGSVFVNENSAKEFVDEMGPATKIEDLDALCTLTADEEQHLANMNARVEHLKAADKTKQVETLATARTQLNEFCAQVKMAFEPLQSEKHARYRTAIDAVNHFQELATSEGVQSLEKYTIPEVGSPSWRSFIQAARTYATTIEANRGDVQYPSKDDNCVFCLQPVGDKQKTVIEAYWDLLKSSAAAELKKGTTDLATIARELGQLPTLTFNKMATVFETVNQFDPKLAGSWVEVIKLYDENRKAVVEAIDNLDASELPEPLVGTVADFDACGDKLDTDRLALIESNPKEEIENLEAEIDLFSDRTMLGKVRKKAAAYLEGVKWAADARGKLAPLAPTKITKIQGLLYGEHVTEEYVTVFNEECKQLKAPDFVQIKQKNVKGSTLRKLEIEKQKAMKVLSEGQQRAVAIADFVTEARMNPHNRGVVFDDPVCSQDHERREQIAARLVELAKMKQVVVFTHDIIFFLRLNAIAEQEHIATEITTIRTTDTPGVVSPDLPLVILSVKKRIGWLRNRHATLVKLAKDGDQNEYFVQMKIWYEILREAWERAVEEHLFKDVVQRYDPRIQTRRLQDVRVTVELVEVVTKAMTESSGWVHDSGSALNPTPPTPDEAAKDLARLDSFVEMCRTAAAAK